MSQFFKSKVHYLGYLVVTDGVQPLPEKVAIKEALEPPRNIDELWHFLGLIGFYRKFIPFFANVTACLNTMLWKGAVKSWMFLILFYMYIYMSQGQFSP